MAIKIKVGKQQEQDKLPEQEQPKKTTTTIKLNARRTLDGNVIIFDHRDIDIVLMPEKRKIVAFAKQVFGDEVYNAQDRLFAFLRKKGVIEFDSIQGGNIYSSMEAKIAESKDYNSTQIALFTINKFMEKERPYFEFEKAFDAEEERRLAEPGPEDSTEYDPERYHSTDKGSIRPGIRPFGIANIYRLEESMEE
tara:strand:- start:3425 stop:4006 length:582 start_codon:yes stop_codon:yes gene_type:complete